MRVTMEKLPGVETVAVRLNDGRAVVQLKLENTLTLEQLRESVRRNGFTPRDARVTATAETLPGDPLRLRISGTPDVYVVHTTDPIRTQLRAAGARPVKVVGRISVENETRDKPVLQVMSVAPIAG